MNDAKSIAEELHLVRQVENQTEQFAPINLSEMDRVKLMDRVDVKYLIPIQDLPSILEAVLLDYKLLEINGERLCTYETLYYDTEKLDLYHAHQRGKMNRYKVRFRNYVGSNLSFFEIKHKNNKGRTIKKRIQQNEVETNLGTEKTEFLQGITPLNAADLQANIWVFYKRMTLVNRVSTERVTIDLNLTFEQNEQSVSYPQVAIAEVKQERLGTSPIIDALRAKGLREGSISKYCLGIMSLNPEIKHNRFKAKFLHLQKTMNSYQ